MNSLRVMWPIVAALLVDAQIESAQVVNSGKPTDILARLGTQRPQEAKIMAAAAGSPAVGWRFAALGDKLRRGVPVTVMVVGGSITAGNGLTSMARAYSCVLERWLNEEFPVIGTSAQRHRVIQAGIHGEGSCFVMK